ncbi:fumarate hydratase [Clostridium tetani]|uniref:Probable 2-(5''-triphosphoribosyl)-3'-dephosphocoenzyme-A synthase n=1 Tax=Clostridium tetani TaxID=1513 RepID=A0ABY0ER90_CLOTA|nr:triphosphoribosyl-dephospho-CoA synthase CitG [Clostridium tetani]KHO32280.1 fumarate hydratase [Clostridium tetani]RXI39797.1 triphosphoribosyl-dephospho-CoA synthase CitG [Clostridium tetani]RXI57726.1 triphosphoribosyl-dephospho-CoA synthase CitG [Clostridium tetani]RXI67654.1 triphosphoribosyl-dephospho-CoA synthase CitG [Clostridium tetani]
MEKSHQVSDTAFDISSLAIQAMLYEVACNPSPGLVSVISTGSHTDMDHYTFIESTSSLIKYLTLSVQLGFSDENAKDMLKKGRKLGIEAEKDMFKKTKGINTHKGMLFLMGICCIAIGKTIHNKNPFSEIKNVIKDMCRGLVEKELEPLNEIAIKYKSVDEMVQRENLSYGEKLFVLYGMEGIRGEVEKGLPIVFDFSLDFYKEASDLNKNNRLVNTLIGIMQYSEDSNVLHRHSLEELKKMQQDAKIITAEGGMRTLRGKQKILHMEEEFVKKGISPGGSADLLAITVFLSLVEEYINEINN